jgi:hypothetical protein
MRDFDWGTAFIILLIFLFFGACAWTAVMGRIHRAEEDLLGDLPQEPVDGRWCPNRGCGGLIQYKRSRDPDGSMTTWLYCWKCHDRMALHSEPDYASRRAEE